MSGTELDLTAAIDAGWQWAVCCSDCPCGSSETDERRTSEGKEAAQHLIEAALPHIREQLARQVDAGVYEVVLGDTPTVALSIRRQAARIVRGES